MWCHLNTWEQYYIILKVRGITWLLQVRLHVDVGSLNSRSLGTFCALQLLKNFAAISCVGRILWWEFFWGRQEISLGRDKLRVPMSTQDDACDTVDSRDSKSITEFSTNGLSSGAIWVCREIWTISSHLRWFSLAGTVTIYVKSLSFYVTSGL